MARDQGLEEILREDLEALSGEKSGKSMGLAGQVNF